MAYRELELTLLSAQGLKNVNLITRMDAYAVVTISGDPLTRQCTPPDPSGGRNPCWNATLRFAVPPTAAEAAGACLHVLLRAERILGDRDVGEVVVPLADLLAAAPAAAPGGTLQPQLASYQVRKVHRWEPRGVLNVAYRLGPVVAPVEEPPQKKPPARRPAAEREEARAPSPAPRNEGKSNGGLGPEGPTQVCVGPHTQIILGGGPATTMSSPTGSSNVSPRKPDGSWPKQSLHHHGDDPTTAPYAQSMFSPRKEDHSRPKVFSQAEASSHQRALVPASAYREPATSPRAPSSRPPVSTFSSHNSSSFSSPTPPYSLAYPFTPSPSSAHRSTPPPRPLGQSAVGDAFGNKTTSHTDSPRSVSAPHRATSSSPLSSSPLVADHSGMVPSTLSPHPFGQPIRTTSHTNSPRPVSTY